METVAHVLNWVTWVAFLVELVVMLAVVPNRRLWLRHHPLEHRPHLLPGILQVAFKHLEVRQAEHGGGSAPQAFAGIYEVPMPCQDTAMVYSPVPV